MTKQKQQSKIVTVGGGTGQFTLSLGLKDHPIEQEAVVTVADSGGDSGRKRVEYGILPPGDLRQALVALANSPGNLIELMNHRYKNGSMKGQNVGNLLLMAVLELSDNNIEVALEKLKQVFSVKGDVLPVSFDDIQLVATLEDGTVIIGEHLIDEPEHDGSLRITRLDLQPQAMLNPRVAKGMTEADLIVIGPGDLYTSIIPNLLPVGMNEAIDSSEAPIVYIANLVTKWGQTNGMTASDHLDEVNRYLGRRKVDTMIFNSEIPSPDLVERYHDHHEELVKLGNPSCKVETYNLLAKEEPKKIDGDTVRRSLIRHDPNKLGIAVMRELYGSVLI